MNDRDELVRLAPSAMRARLHPWAIVGVWGWQALLALGASLPAASLVRKTFAANPRGDAPLWDAGGHALLDFLWHNAHALAPLLACAEGALLLGAIAGLIPMAALMFAMAYGGRDGAPAGLPRCMASALRVAPPFLFLWLVISVFQVLTAGIAVSAGAALSASTRAILGQARAQPLGIAAGLLLGVPALWGLAMVHDLARAAVVCLQANGPQALGLGARTLGRSPLPLAWTWAWRAVLSLAVVLAVAAWTTPVSTNATAISGLIALLHQGVVLGRVALRASWLASALRAVDASG